MRRVTSHRMRGVLLVMLMTGPVTGVAAVVTARAAGAAVTQFSDPTISDPTSITVGPDDALWFTNSGNNTIGRVTTSGVVTNYADPTIANPTSIAAGPTTRCGSPTTAAIPSGASATAGIVSKYTDPTIVKPIDITAGPDGAMWFTNFNNSIGRISTTGCDHQLHRSQHCEPHQHHRGPGRRVVVHQLQQQLDRPDHHERRDRHALHQPQRRSQQHRGRARRRAVVHQSRQSHDRPDHHRRRGDAIHARPVSRIRTASRPVPMARCGSPTTATTRSGGYRPEAW